MDQLDDPSRPDKAGFTKCEADDRLSQRQLDTLLADKSISERIEIKQLVDLAGIWPAEARR